MIAKIVNQSVFTNAFWAVKVKEKARTYLFFVVVLNKVRQLFLAHSEVMRVVFLVGKDNG